MRTDHSQLTALLRRWSAGDAIAFEQLLPMVYERLRQIARQRRRHESDDTLDTTGLVHEAYLRLVEAPTISVHDRGHFYALASRVMRHLLTDQARMRRSAKRGGGLAAVELGDALLIADQDLDRIEALHDALVRLEALDRRQAAIIEMRYFGGLSLDETAEALQLSLSTVNRELRAARAWLGHMLADESAG